MGKEECFTVEKGRKETPSALSDKPLQPNVPHDCCVEPSPGGNEEQPEQLGVGHKDLVTGGSTFSSPQKK